MIPRVLHQVWIGDRPMPDEFEAWAAGWRELHPGWEYLRWGDADLDTFGLRNRELWDRAPELATGNGVHQLRVDVARYEILERLGGVYVDADFEPRRPLEELLAFGPPDGAAFAGEPTPDEAGAFAAWEAEGRWINNAIMGAAPGHPFLRNLVRWLPANVDKVHQQTRGRARPNRLSGPQYLTAVVNATRPDLVVLPKALFYPYLWNELDRWAEPFPDAYAVHHWNNRRSAA